MNHLVKRRYLIIITAGIFFLLLRTSASYGQSNACATATAITSTPGCVTLAGNTATSTYTAAGGLPGCGLANPDVWYSFVAKSTNPTITTVQTGGAGQRRSQLFSGGCGALVSLGCSGASNTLVAAGLTIGNTYLIRIYSNNISTFTFTICVTDPAPANDACAGAIVLTSGLACVNTTGNMYAATDEAVIPIAPCTGPVVYDVWYRFVAQVTDPTITLSSIGSNITSPRMQLISGSCAAPVSAFCGTTSIVANGLTVGASYFIRVYASGGTAPTTPTNSGFDICIVDPVPPAPPNNECVNAITLPVGGSCSNINGTMASSTPSATPVAPCTGPLGYDVWYKFIPVNTTTTITLSSIGANFTNANLQMFSGTCGALTSIFCGSPAIAAVGLTPGATYYVRVYSTSLTPPNGNAGFNICATTASPPPRFGNSYVNLSKRSTGGTVQTGDTLEIRMTVNHTSGTMYALRYVDNIPTKTVALAGLFDSIRVITNEGYSFRKYTPLPGDDAATYQALPPVGEYNIRLNLGFGAWPPAPPVNNTETESASAIGRMNAAADLPRGGGGMIFATSYRVVVTGIPGDTIRLNAGKFIYRTIPAGADISLIATPYEILVSNPQTLCANATGVNNAQEVGGTFGSGSTLNRSSDLQFPIPGYTYLGNVSSTIGVGDGRYAVVKNISPRSGTIRTADRTPTCPAVVPDEQACAFRMHGGHWDVDGDHTGTNNSIGNIPPAATAPGGYMLMVNADYVASETYRQTLTNLCPNTYYEFSAWIRNVCPTCGIDSAGVTYTPRRPGVLPNLTFALDGLDRYNTGEVSHSSGWIQKGFVFTTGPSQTSATFSIRNNSQGGGGNDWVLDDISIATCLPNMSYSPTLTPTVCDSNSITINDTVRSVYNNYTHYKWQRSTNGGASWTDVTPAMGPAVPTWNGTAWEYVTSYTIPPSNTLPADSGDLYRLIVATTTANLSNIDCQVTDGINIITLDVINCNGVLKTDLLSFSGKLANTYAQLAWTTSREEEPVHFEVEKSLDGINFLAAGRIPGHNSPSAELNRYSFTDLEVFPGKAWYRIALVNASGQKKYSNIVRLSTNKMEFSVDNIVNPFKNELVFQVSMAVNSKIDVALLDLYGKVVKTNTYKVNSGVNSISLENTDVLPAGIYILQVNHSGITIRNKVLKK